MFHIEPDHYIEVEQEDVIDFVLTYSLTDYLDVYMSIYRTLGKREMGRLLLSIERRFIYG